MHRPGRQSLVRLLGVIAVAAAPLLVPRAMRAQDLACDPGDLEVRSLRFDGNRAFSDEVLSAAIVTTPSSWARRKLKWFGTRRCLDVAELPRDSLRLELFYRKHGYYRSQIGLDTRQKGKNGVAVRFRVMEGPPLRIDTLSVVFDVTDGPVEDSVRIRRDIGLRVGDPFDRYRLQDAIGVVTARLQNSGYPRGEVLLGYDVDTSALRAAVTLTVVPRARARIGDVRVTVQPEPGNEQQIPTRVVERLSGLRRGNLVRARDLVNAQRNLYELDAYRHVDVRLAGDSAQVLGDSAMVVDVSLIEGDMKSIRAGFGWGTIDCFRTSTEYVDRNFLRGARRLELSARLSKLGYGRPTRLGNGTLCNSALRADSLFSSKLNYFAGATFRQPTLFGLGPRSIPTITLYSERRSEYQAFLRRTPIGGIASLTRDLRVRLPLTLSYELSYGRTEAQPALYCAAFRACDAIEQQQLKQQRVLAVASAALVRDRTNDPFNPSSGTVLRGDMRYASNKIGSDNQLQFIKWVGDAAAYVSLGPRVVLATRVRGGGVTSATSLDVARGFVPPQERLYAGGSSTVRGFQQNELGTAAYVVDRYHPDTVQNPAGDTIYFRTDADAGIEAVVPTGGDLLFVGNVELRIVSPLFPDLIQWTLFTDVGQVWNRSRDAESLRSLGEILGSLRSTPGAGVRVFTPFGAVRVDVGYNWYDRPSGPAYYIAPVSETGVAPLYCVSPTNSLPVTDGDPPAQLSGNCPDSFQPTTRRGFFRRLNFNFSIGQAF